MASSTLAIRAEPHAIAADDAPAPSARFSTGGLPPGDRFDYWASLYRPFADIEVDADSRAGFHARSETWRVGRFTVTDAQSADAAFRRTPAHCARADGDFWVFRVAADTAWTCADGAGVERIGRGELFMRRTDRPSLTAVPTGRYRLLLLPCAADAALTAGLSRLRQGRMAGVGAALLGDMLSALPARLRRIPAAELPLLAVRLRDVIAACLLRDLPPAALERAVGGRMARDRVAGVIRAHIGSARLDVDRISRLAGVSRSALYRMFEDEGGVARHVRDLRLAMVMQDFADPALATLPIAQIAERRGLHSPASFSRAFRRAYGCRPSEARAAVAGLGPCAPEAAAPRDPLGRR